MNMFRRAIGVITQGRRVNLVGVAIPRRSFSSTIDFLKPKRNFLKIFVAFAGLNGAIAYAYIKKVESSNQYALPTLMKLLEFKKTYASNPTAYSQVEIERLFDEFLVENIVATLDEKHTSEIRAIAEELCEKYPKSREIQYFTCEVIPENSQRAKYLKAAMLADRKYIDEVFIRQMELTSSRFGKQNPLYFEEFFQACTKFNLKTEQDQANKCFSTYLALNPPNYFRGAMQRIRNESEIAGAAASARMLDSIQDVFDKVSDLDEKEKDDILQFVAKVPLKDFSDKSTQIKAAKLLVEHGSNPLPAQPIVKAILEKDAQNIDALKIQLAIYQNQKKSELIPAISDKITRLENQNKK